MAKSQSQTTEHTSDQDPAHEVTTALLPAAGPEDANKGFACQFDKVLPCRFTNQEGLGLLFFYHFFLIPSSSTFIIL